MAPDPQPTPPAARLSILFFALSGLLELCLLFADTDSPSVVALWEALGRAILHWLVALGLWQRLALCRTVGIVYCLAALVTYAVVLALALGGAPVRFPPSVVVESLFQVPSCALLLPWLRSAEAGRAFPRPLVPR
jgi:uncharacterized membrane protein